MDNESPTVLMYLYCSLGLDLVDVRCIQLFSDSGVELSFKPRSAFGSDKCFHSSENLKLSVLKDGNECHEGLGVSHYQ